MPDSTSQPWTSNTWNRVFDFSQFQLAEPFTASVENRAHSVTGNDTVATAQNAVQTSDPLTPVPVPVPGVGTVLVPVPVPTGAIQGAADVTRSLADGSFIRTFVQTISLYMLATMLIGIGTASLLWSNRDSVKAGVKKAGEVAA